MAVCVLASPLGSCCAHPGATATATAATASPCDLRRRICGDAAQGGRLLPGLVQHLLGALPLRTHLHACTHAPSHAGRRMSSADRREVTRRR
eukprot:COSAG01_NODE_56108_length_320_cov_1.407240_1_plen_91_part_10